MPAIVAGSVYGNWTVIERKPGQAKHPKWKCICLCGTVSEVDQGNLTRGKTVSCGCIKFPSATRTHGMSRDPLIGVWRNIISRCQKPGHASFKNYGARGISVCDRWLSLEDFCTDVGPHPGNGLTFERLNNDGNYEPGNVTWATRAEQARNKRSTQLITVGGVTQCLQDWANSLGATAHHVYRRARKGMSFEQAIVDLRENPPTKRGPYKTSKTTTTKEIT